MTRVYAQGDVTFIPVAGPLPAEATPLPQEQGRYIFAHGEVTGHHHSTLPRPGVTYAEAQGVRYLSIAELVGEVSVEHQEHRPVTLPPGLYEVRRQREATDNDEGWVNVRD